MTHCPFCGAQAEDVLLHMATDCPDRGLVVVPLRDLGYEPDEAGYADVVVCPCGWQSWVRSNNLVMGIESWRRHLAAFPDPVAHFVIDSVYDGWTRMDVP
jgi:hypothetical protein